MLHGNELDLSLGDQMFVAEHFDDPVVVDDIAFATDRVLLPGEVVQTFDEDLNEVAPPRITVNGKPYKPGTRKVEPKNSSSGERPWWTSDDPQVWAANQARMQARGKSDNHNLVGWKGVGTSASVRY